MSLKAVAERALHGLGAVQLIRAGKRGRCRILMYHRFDGPEEETRARVELQCEHLRRYYRPTSLSEIAEAIRTGSKLPENGLVITVDDAYADVRLAYPIFHSFGLKVIVYVVSEFSAGDLWLWPDQVKFAFDRTTAVSITLPLPTGEITTFTLENSAARAHAFDVFAQSAIRSTNQQRLQSISDLAGRLGVALPASAPAGCEALSWEELRTLSAQGLEIGSHTRTHPIVSRLENDRDTTEEIAGSKARIEAALNLKVRHFCYPNGTSADYDERSVAAVRDAGYETAVTTEPGLVNVAADPYRLKRIGMDPSLPELYFERRVAGLSA